MTRGRKVHWADQALRDRTGKTSGPKKKVWKSFFEGRLKKKVLFNSA